MKFRPWRAQGFRSTFTPRDSFDEIVIADWLHVERLGPGHVWIRVGPVHINVTDRGRMAIRIERDGDDAPCAVEVDGDITGEREAQQTRFLRAYEAARGWDRNRAPEPEMLRVATIACGMRRSG